MIIWTKATVDYVIQHAGTMSDEDLATSLSKMLGVNVAPATLRKKRQRLGLKKTGGRGVVALATRTHAEEKVDDGSPTTPEAQAKADALRAAIMAKLTPEERKALFQ